MARGDDFLRCNGLGGIARPPPGGAGHTGADRHSCVDAANVRAAIVHSPERMASAYFGTCRKMRAVETRDKRW